MVRASWLLLLVLAGCGVRRALADLEPEAAPTGVIRPDPETASEALRALVAEQDGDLASAEKSWRWLVRLHPDDPGAWAGYGGFLERTQRGSDALEAYARVIALDARHTAAHLGSARILLGRGDDGLAASHLEAAAGSEDPDVMLLLARLYVRRNDVRSAWVIYDVWSKNPPERQGECLDRARLALAIDRPGDAVDDLRCALDDEDGGPPVAETFVKAARASCRVGTAWRWTLEHRLAERDTADWRAVAVAIGLAAGDPDLVDAALGPGEGLETGLIEDRVEILVREGRAEEALALLEQAQDLRPDDVALRLRAAGVLAAMGREAEALKVLDTVDPADRFHPAAQRLRAEIWMATGRPADAVALLGAMPEPPWPTQVLYARALAASGRVGDAEALLLGPEGEPERWRQVALLRADRGDMAGAIEAFDAAGDDPRALVDRAALLERLGQPSAEAWQKAADTSPSAVSWKGVARTSGDPMPALLRAVESDPCDPEARRLLAAHEGACDAVETLERAWDAAPRNTEVLSALATAYPACGEARRAAGEPLDGLIEGLGTVEWTWRVLARQDEADRVAALRRALEGA